MFRPDHIQFRTAASGVEVNFSCRTGMRLRRLKILPTAGFWTVADLSDTLQLVINGSLVGGGAIPIKVWGIQTGPTPSPTPGGSPFIIAFDDPPMVDGADGLRVTGTGETFNYVAEFDEAA